MTDFKDRTVLITGAARGIGQATALRFAAGGAKLALCDLQTDWLDETVEKAKALGAEVTTHAVDVSSAEAVQQAVADVLEAHGAVHVLVNNAGITKDGLLARMSEDDWDAVLNVNLKGAFLFTKALARSMMKQRGGSIVNIASIIGVIGNAGQANYAASKGGLIALTKSCAKEMAARNIRVNAVAPGFIETRMTEKLPEDVQERMLQAIPLARFGQPEDVANVVAFLAGEEAAYVTGQCLTVCGGMVT